MATAAGRPGDDETVPLVDALRWQQAYVSAAGSPTAALILEAVIDDLASAGPLSSALPPVVRFGSLPGLRVMAAVHLLALTRRAPQVALWLPTLGGTAPATAREREAFRTAVIATLLSHPDVLADSLAHTPQTNETGRAALLRHALVRMDVQGPVRLLEIGASAGLNLRVDHLPGLPSDDGQPVPEIVERLGCDLAPVDITSPEGRALLTSYVWVDDVDRFERLRTALQVASTVPASVLREDAISFVERMAVQPGRVTVLWHSAMWLYLDSGTQQAIIECVHRSARAARPDAPLVHVSWEWDPQDADGHDFALVSRTWDGASAQGRPTVLAVGRSHGEPVRVLRPARPLDAEPLLSGG